MASSGTSRQLDLREEDNRLPQPRKRKSKVATPVTQTLDLNIPIGGSSVIVPVGLVNSMVNQLDRLLRGVEEGASLLELGTDGISKFPEQCSMVMRWGL